MKAQPFKIAVLLRAQWLSLVLVTVVGSIVFATLSAKYQSSDNWYGLLQEAATIAVIGFAQMVVLAVGELSLAVGGIGGLVTVVVGGSIDSLGLPLELALLFALAVGAACGWLNGLITTRTRVSGFIVTLATGGAFTGVTLGITHSVPYTPIPSALNHFGTGRIGFFPYLALVPIVVGLALAVLLNLRPTGRNMLAVGGNREAAELSGILSNRTVIWAHTLSGLLAAIAAIMFVGQLHSALPATGSDWLIESFAAPIIGGAALNGGEAAVMGTIWAAIVLSMIDNGLVLVNVNQYWVQFLEGLLILIAVGFGRLRAARQHRRTPRGLRVGAASARDAPA